MGKPHVHAELIKAWADGAEIEFYDPRTKSWEVISSPLWENKISYRIKPEPKEDIYVTINSLPHYTKVNLIFDGETKKFKTANLLIYDK